jgi:hypothetical protein
VTDPLTLPPPRRRAGLGKVVLVAVALFVVAELAVRLLAPALPTPGVWPDLATATKVAQLDREAARGCADVVFVGNSMTRDDFVPGVFTDADPSGRTAYNAALDAASPELLVDWVDDEVLPATDPGTVVIGVSSFDLNDAATIPAAALRAYDDAPYTGSTLVAEIEQVLTEALALVRHREALRDPEVVIDAVADRIGGDRADRPDPEGIAGVIAADGHGLSRRDLRFRDDASTVARLRQQFLEPFEITGDQAAALTELVQVVADHGATPVVVVLPVTEAYVAAHPDGAADVGRFRTALADALAGTAAVVLDAPALPDRAFADTHHLNATGADALSSALPALLDRAGVPISRCTAP